MKYITIICILCLIFLSGCYSYLYTSNSGVQIRSKSSNIAITEQIENGNNIIKIVTPINKEIIITKEPFLNDASGFYIKSNMED